MGSFSWTGNGSQSFPLGEWIPQFQFNGVMPATSPQSVQGQMITRDDSNPINQGFELGVIHDGTGDVRLTFRDNDQANGYNQTTSDKLNLGNGDITYSASVNYNGNGFTVAMSMSNGGGSQAINFSASKSVGPGAGSEYVSTNGGNPSVSGYTMLDGETPIPDPQILSATGSPKPGNSIYFTGQNLTSKPFDLKLVQEFIGGGGVDPGELDLFEYDIQSSQLYGTCGNFSYVTTGAITNWADWFQDYFSAQKTNSVTYSVYINIESAGWTDTGVDLLANYDTPVVLPGVQDKGLEVGAGQDENGKPRIKTSTGNSYPISSSSSGAPDDTEINGTFNTLFGPNDSEIDSLAPTQWESLKFKWERDTLLAEQARRRMEFRQRERMIRETRDIALLLESINDALYCEEKSLACIVKGGLFTEEGFAQIGLSWMWTAIVHGWYLNDSQMEDIINNRGPIVNGMGLEVPGPWGN